MPENKISVVVIGNSGAELSKTVSVLQNYPDFLIMGEAKNGKDGLSLIYNFVPDLIITELDLLDISGFELSRILNNRQFNPRVIFLAEDDAAAFESLSLHPFDFWIKPVDNIQIDRMLDRYMVQTKKELLTRKMEHYTKNLKVNTQRVFFHKDGIIVLYLNEIVICKANLSKSDLILTCDNKIQVVTTISETIEIINDSNFIKVSRSFWINRKYLHKIDNRRLKCVLIYDGKTREVPVSRDSLNMLERLLTYQVY